MKVDNQLSSIQESLREFAIERDWEKFHDPKNLVMALSGEVGELTEIFQWISNEESNHLTDKQLKQVKEEIADVYLYLLRLADVTNVDLVEASKAKIEINRNKYPVSQSYGHSKKHTEF